MAAKIDSQKRRSPRLLGTRIEPVTPDPRGHEEAPSGYRTSEPRTRLSGGKRNDLQSGGSSSLRRSQRRSKAEDPGNGSKAGAIGGATDNGETSVSTTVAQVPGESHHPTEDRTAAPAEKNVKTRRSRDNVQNRGKPSHPGPKEDGGLTPSMVNREGNGEKEEAGASHMSKVAESAKAGPPVKRTEGVEAGPSDVYKAGEVTGPSRPSSARENENANTSVLSPSRRLVCGARSPIRSADQGSLGAASGSAPPRDSKVQCSSKQVLQNILGMCSKFSKDILESQNYLSEEQRQLEHRSFVWNFETAFQDNVCVNGQSWHEAPDTASEPDIHVLEDQLDDAILKTALKRKRHPRKILGHFVKALQVEREILDHYKPVVEPKELKLDSRSESRMMEQTATTAAISQQIKDTMKALPAQLEKAQGFSQVLNLQPLLQGSRIRQDIFSSRVILQDVAKTVPKALETTPGENNEPVANIASLRSMKRRPSSLIHSRLYPLRSKRKISLEG